MYRLNIVNNALLKAVSDSDVESAMRTFTGFVLRVSCSPHSDLALENSLTKLSC